MVRKTVYGVEYDFFDAQTDKWIKRLDKNNLIDTLKRMLTIRNFEIRAESAYQQGKVGGFFHAYMGQEAIQTAAVDAIGIRDNWWITTYRCHALAYLLGAHPNEMMAELYGKITGNALGRGGSMHLYADRLLGGFGIVGGHVPIATGAAFSLKYQKQNGVALCFLGDGAVAQGAVHESLNLASLWDLPCIYVIENNRWGMGTAVDRAICVQPIAQNLSKSYDIASYTFDGMDYFSCYNGFHHVHEEVKKIGRPVLVEAVTERFRGHSISDPGLYRSKQELAEAKSRDPIFLFGEKLKAYQIITQEHIDELGKQQKKLIMASIKFAEDSPHPDPITLEEGVFAP